MFLLRLAYLLPLVCITMLRKVALTLAQILAVLPRLLRQLLKRIAVHTALEIKGK
jgi:hypothetical protein